MGKLLEGRDWSEGLAASAQVRTPSSQKPWVTPTDSEARGSFTPLHSMSHSLSSQPESSAFCFAAYEQVSCKRTGLYLGVLLLVHCEHRVTVSINGLTWRVTSQRGRGPPGQGGLLQNALVLLPSKDVR